MRREPPRIGRTCRLRALCTTIPDDRGDESFADDLNMGRGIVSGRVALLLRSTEIPPHRPKDFPTKLIDPQIPSKSTHSYHLISFSLPEKFRRPAGGRGAGSRVRGRRREERKRRKQPNTWPPKILFSSKNSRPQKGGRGPPQGAQDPRITVIFGAPRFNRKPLKTPTI